MTTSAICIGINYTGKSYALNGCINDCEFVMNMLMNNYGYSRESIRQMTDKCTGENRPTRANIIKAILTCKSDVLFLSYSGHGVLSKDGGSMDKSGFCQNLYDIDGQNLSDVDLLRCIRDCRAKKVYAFFDCCHSGTILNLRVRYNHKKRKIIEDNYYANMTDKDVTVFSVQSCEDSEVSAEFSGSGILTMALARVLREFKNSATYARILDVMNDMSKRQHSSVSGSQEVNLDEVWTLH